MSRARADRWASKRRRSEHPIFAVFRGEGLTGLASTRTRGFALLEPGAASAIDIPLRYVGGQPAMVTAEVGRGRVAMWTSSLDRDLTDFPIRPAFVPWTRRTVLWLGRALQEIEDPRTVVGDVRAIRAPAGATQLRIVDPNDDATWVSVTAGAAAFDRTNTPGHYRVFGENGTELVDERFAVNVDPAESDLRPLSLADAEVVLVGGPTGRAAARQAAMGVMGDGWTSATGITALLALMIFSFGLESVLTARRIGRA